MVDTEKRAPDLSDLESILGYRMKRAYMRIHRDLKPVLDEFQLTQRNFSVLSVVIGNPGISQSEISRALAIERSGTVVIVDELESRDLITRERVPGDRRAYALHPTEAGQDFYIRARDAIQGAERTIMSGLSDAEAQQLTALLSTIQSEES
ncbi:MarR family winged helix-turn-helix transcriptional regulator [Mesobacterium pallidum]|uniref:MarR family winged helix-turn-helix transcriptional regulator n=1 Tax=Mesobacterium pallidum TaxID=2872037 RepID=UPI001EE25AF0|nr:MarR family transcriptional regulator [Mesobacterium pallidum]